MRARAELTAAPPLTPGGPCRLVRLRDAAPVAWRPTPQAVYVVGTAASPVGDDQVEMDVLVESGATLQVRSAAATVAWRAGVNGAGVNGAGVNGHSGASSQQAATAQRVDALVAQGAHLDWHLEPFIATAGCHHRQTVRLRLEGTGRVHWVEEVILGRHGEAPGRLDLRLDVDVDRIPLLRHQLALGPGVPGWNGPAVLGAHRCLGLVLDAGGDRPRQPPEVAAGTTPGGSWTVLELDGPGILTLAVAGDLPALRQALAAAAAGSTAVRRAERRGTFPRGSATR